MESEEANEVIEIQFVASDEDKENKKRKRVQPIDSDSDTDFEECIKRLRTPSKRMRKPKKVFTPSK